METLPTCVQLKTVLEISTNGIFFDKGEPIYLKEGFYIQIDFQCIQLQG
jgi:hypothetical protein